MPDDARPPPQRAVRLLHVVESFDGQAVESWILNVVRCAKQIDRTVHWTFFCIQTAAGVLDDQVREMDATVIHTRHPIGSKLRFIASLRKTMAEGAYDVLHCHHDLMSAPALLASAGLPFRRRIVHIHNTALSIPTSNPVKIALMREPMRHVCLHAADGIVGVSREALDAMLAGRSSRPGRDQVVHCGIDTNRFTGASCDRLRRDLGVPVEAKVLLFVGRMTTYKNPLFVIEILEQLGSQNGDFYAVFAGKGPLEEEARNCARARGLGTRVRVLGWRTDVPELMQSADVLVWPGVEEPKEGLGLGVVEAQAAGLRVVMSRNVPEEAVVLPELVRTLSLSSGAARWAEEITSLINNEMPARETALAAVKASSFAIEQSTKNVLDLYRHLA